ncbi:unnamed protein product, partial [Prorocentrum cordatum]
RRLALHRGRQFPASVRRGGLPGVAREAADAVAVDGAVGDLPRHRGVRLPRSKRQ